MPGVQPDLVKPGWPTAIEDLVDSATTRRSRRPRHARCISEIVHPPCSSDENLLHAGGLPHGMLCWSTVTAMPRVSAMCGLGSFAGPRFNNYKMGYRFGQLGYRLVEKRNLTRYQAGYLISLGTLTPWAKHVATGRDLVRRAFDVAYRTGDLRLRLLLAQPDHELSVRGRLPSRRCNQRRRKASPSSRRQIWPGGRELRRTLGLIRTLRGLTSTFGSFRRPGL